jgi:NTE family protein
MEICVTGRLGKRFVAEGDYRFLTSPLSWFNFHYGYNHSDINFNANGMRDINLTFNHHYASFSFINMNFLRQNLKMELGIAYQNHYFHRWLANVNIPVLEDQKPIVVEDEHLISYFARLDFETIDNSLFTHRGTVLSAYYEYFTDNFYQYRGHFPFHALSFKWMTAFPFSKRFSFIPSVYGRVIFGAEVPFSKLNVVGGKYFGRYLPQQLPFDGIGFMEIAPHSLVAAKVQVRERIGRRHFVSASFNYALGENNFLDLVKTGKHYWGGSLDYGYNFRLLPIMGSFSWSNIARFGFYVQAGYLF